MAPTAFVRPAHLSAVALLLIIWHGALVADYLNLRLALAEDLPVMRALLPVAPLWVDVAWAMAVLLGLVAALFLVFRDDAAVLLMFAASVAMAAAVAGLWGLMAAPLQGPMVVMMPLLVLVPLAGWLYARGLKRQGSLH